MDANPIELPPLPEKPRAARLLGFAAILLISLGIGIVLLLAWRSVEAVLTPTDNIEVYDSMTAE